MSAASKSRIGWASLYCTCRIVRSEEAVDIMMVVIKYDVSVRAEDAF